MDSLPVELITTIAFFACTDGGFTGASLSAVSKRIRDATHCTRFLSAFLSSSPERFTQFLTSYLAQRYRIPEVMPQVRHLFLSLLPIEGEPIHRFPPLHPALILGEYDKYLRRLGDLGDQYGPLVCSLIQTLAPTLETFTFVRGEWKNVPQLHCTFPRLRELTLVDGAPEFLRIADVPQGRVPLFPRLERMHIIECFYARPVDLRQWAPHAPALTHVRISGLHFRDSPTVASLKDVSCALAEEGGGGGEESTPPFFPCLQHVLVQPTSAKRHLAFMQLGQRRLLVYLQMASEKTRAGIVFDVLSAHDPLYGTVANNSVESPPPAEEGGGGARARVRALLGHCEARDGADGRTETGPARCLRLARREEGEGRGRVGCWTKEYLF
uniref:MFS domain-containing protein n=1 Tax=Ganoderma boninense TaxID=34458 RepID=A0A5K1K484_9APHY|nr:MFS domain-containing protein [Ganoderma boninense]